MLKNEIFSYQSAREVFCAIYESKRGKNPRFSIRAWSRQLGYQNPSLLSQVFKGERTISADLAQRVAKSSTLSAVQSRYLETLALRERARTEIEIQSCDELLARLRKAKSARKVSLDHFRLIADWHHLALLELLALRDFQADPEWMSQRLGGAVSSSTIRLAIERLKRLGILVSGEKGMIKRQDQTPLEIDPAVRDLAVQTYHEQMISKSIDALKTQDLAEREYRGSTLSIKKENYSKAQKLIRRFHRSMIELAEDTGADETYQLNVQFFKLSHEVNKKKVN